LAEALAAVLETVVVAEAEAVVADVLSWLAAAVVRVEIAPA
jgi:hypothetical protein